MKDLDVGMYIRTKYGISKIEKIEEDKIHKTIWCTVDKAQYHSFLVRKQEILKVSYNLIDLIEVGDYVNGFKIIRRFVNIHNGKKLLIALEKEEGYEYSNNLNDYMGDDSIHIYNEDIKTIVTKEQFESMSYKVKE